MKKNQQTFQTTAKDQVKKNVIYVTKVIIHLVTVSIKLISVKFVME